MQPAAPGRMTTPGPASESNPQTTSATPGIHSQALTEILTEQIRGSGPITFAEFMRECLYHPVHGYYSRVSSRRFGDYYTSVDVHPIFGRLLGRQFAEMWELLGRPRPFILAEAAAGVGQDKRPRTSQQFPHLRELAPEQ